MTAPTKNAPAPAATGNEGLVTNAQEGNNIMSIVDETPDTTTPCSRYAWCQGHGGFIDGGVPHEQRSHIGEDEIIAVVGGRALFCPQISKQDGNGIAFELDSDILITADNVDEFERTIRQVIDAVRAQIASYPEVSA